VSSGYLSHGGTTMKRNNVCVIDLLCNYQPASPTTLWAVKDVESEEKKIFLEDLE